MARSPPREASPRAEVRQAEAQDRPAFGKPVDRAEVEGHRLVGGVPDPLGDVVDLQPRREPAGDLLPVAEAHGDVGHGVVLARAQRLVDRAHLDLARIQRRDAGEEGSRAADRQREGHVVVVDVGEPDAVRVLDRRVAQQADGARVVVDRLDPAGQRRRRRCPARPRARWARCAGRCRWSCPPCSGRTPPDRRPGRRSQRRSVMPAQSCSCRSSRSSFHDRELAGGRARGAAVDVEDVEARRHIEIVLGAQIPGHEAVVGAVVLAGSAPVRPARCRCGSCSWRAGRGTRSAARRVRKPRIARVRNWPTPRTDWAPRRARTLAGGRRDRCTRPGSSKSKTSSALKGRIRPRLQGVAGGRRRRRAAARPIQPEAPGDLGNAGLARR